MLAAYPLLMCNRAIILEEGRYGFNQEEQDRISMLSLEYTPRSFKKCVSLFDIFIYLSFANRYINNNIIIYSLLDRISESPPSMIETTEQLNSLPQAVPNSVLSPE